MIPGPSKRLANSKQIPPHKFIKYKDSRNLENLLL